MLFIFLDYLLVIYLRYFYKRELCFSLMHVFFSYLAAAMTLVRASMLALSWSILFSMRTSR